MVDLLPIYEGTKILATPGPGTERTCVLGKVCYERAADTKF